ncbi:MAG: EthD domain-containing protein [Dehalococcoidales bacterium]
MIKVIVVVKRKPGISREEFYKYWKEVHGPLVAKHIPGLRKYIQNHFIEVPGYEYEGDGIIETWYDSVESYLKSMEFSKNKESRPLLEDWAKIADMSPPKMWIVEEHVIKDELSRK